jgi:endoglycosylceramidase
MKVFPKLLEGYARVIAQKTGKVPSEQEMADMWGNEPKRVEALGLLNNKTDYGTIVDGAFEPVRVFEEGSLTTFYQRVRDAVREVNKKQILFLEHTYFCNLGISSSFHIPLDKYGNKDSLCAYAPHGYDLVTDTKGVSNPGYERVELIFDRIFKAGKQKGVPLIVDEWGAFYMGDNLYVDPARHLIGLFEKNLAGQTYWSYWEKIETQDYFKNTLVRPYPVRSNGKLLSYANEPVNGSFSCSWEETDSDAPTLIYFPDLGVVKKEAIQISPVSDLKFIPIDNTSAGYVEITPLAQKRSFHITF